MLKRKEKCITSLLTSEAFFSPIGWKDEEGFYMLSNEEREFLGIALYSKLECGSCSN